jgi:hypothetical protein
VDRAVRGKSLKGIRALQPRSAQNHGGESINEPLMKACASVISLYLMKPKSLT